MYILLIYPVTFEGVITECAVVTLVPLVSQGVQTRRENTHVCGMGVWSGRMCEGMGEIQDSRVEHRLTSSRRTKKNKRKFECLNFNIHNPNHD